MRVHLGALERKLGVRFPSDHPVLAWMAEFVRDSCTKYLQGADGRTAYERLFGKPCREEALEFGEVVLFRPKKRALMRTSCSRPAGRGAFGSAGAGGAP